MHDAENLANLVRFCLPSRGLDIDHFLQVRVGENMMAPGNPHKLKAKPMQQVHQIVKSDVVYRPN